MEKTSDDFSSVLKKTGTISITSQQPTSVQFLINTRKIFYKKAYLTYHSKSFTAKHCNFVSLLLSPPWGMSANFQMGTSKKPAYMALGCPHTFVVLKGHYLNKLHIHKDRIVAFSEGLEMKESHKSIVKSVLVTFDQAATELQREEAFLIIKSNGDCFFKTMSEDDGLMLRRECLAGFSDGVLVKKRYFRKEFEELNGNGLVIFESNFTDPNTVKPISNGCMFFIGLLIFKFILITSLLTSMNAFGPEFEQLLRDMYNM